MQQSTVTYHISPQQEPSSDYDINIANKIYVSSNLLIQQRFGAIVESDYFTTASSLDFAQPQIAAQTINDWVANATHNRIANLVDEDQLQQAVVVLLNAIYFKAEWRRTFDAAETAEAPFFVPVASTVRSERAAFMHTTAPFFYLQSGPLGASVLRLPYKGGRFAMTLILPAAEGLTALDEVVQRLNSESLHAAQYNMDTIEVRVQVPKFRFDYTASLIPALEQVSVWFEGILNDRNS